MEKTFEGKQISFYDICEYIDGCGSSKLKSLVKNICIGGMLFLPVTFAKYTGYHSFINEIATGATLVGAGVFNILGSALNDLFASKKYDKEMYIRMQTVYQLSFYSSLFEAICEELEAENVIDLFEKNASEDLYDILYDEENEEDIFISFNSIDVVRRNYVTLTEEFRERFYSTEEIKELFVCSEEQKEYFDYKITNIPEVAIKKFRNQILNLITIHKELECWISMNIFANIQDEIKKLPDSIVEHISDKVVKNMRTQEVLDRELLQQKQERYFYLFESDDCEVETVFTLNNYYITEIESKEASSHIQSFDNIIDLINRQRYLLVTGPYGSGKTTLLKRLYLEYRRRGTVVYAFDARDLVETVCSGREFEFNRFFDCVCDVDAIILIDALDDLNVAHSTGSDISLLETFIGCMFNYLKRNKRISFVVGSREYAYIGDTKEDSVAEKFFYYTENHQEMKFLKASWFEAADVNNRIDKYPMKNGVYLNKRIIKDENKKITNALHNPLFLYAFIKQYEETKEIKAHEGYYYYYEKFIDQTIQGKYHYEALGRANVISDNVKKYKNLLQKIAYDILNTNSNRIRSIINPLQVLDDEPLLAEKLQEHKFCITFEDFSQATKECFDQLKSESIDKANFINCYFLKVVGNTIFFTDVNILFSLASERIYLQLMELAEKEAFDLCDLDRLDVIDFYPQVIDYVLYKISTSGDKKALRVYLRSFVLNRDIRNRIDVAGKNAKEIGETFAQILMMYILFFKLCKNTFSDEYGHIFKEMIFYVNAYKTYSHENMSSKEIFTVERYFMRNVLTDIFLKRVNLKHFNFKGSVIRDSRFMQCKLMDTSLQDSELQGKITFDLCEFNDVNMKTKKIEEDNSVLFRDCIVKKMELTSRKRCRFIRCFVEHINIDFRNGDQMIFEECLIKNINIIAEQFKPSDVKIIFSACTFETQIDLTKYEGKIEIKSKSINLKGGNLFKGIIQDRITGLDKIL